MDIESILSKRAKSPWLDTGYALLSYLLTCKLFCSLYIEVRLCKTSPLIRMLIIVFALLVWIVIYILKLGQKVILFPRQLWKAYSDYLVERNKVVKKASMQSVVGGGVGATNGATTSLFQQNRRASSTMTNRSSAAGSDSTRKKINST